MPDVEWGDVRYPLKMLPAARNKPSTPSALFYRYGRYWVWLVFAGLYFYGNIPGETIQLMVAFTIAGVIVAPLQVLSLTLAQHVRRSALEPEHAKRTVWFGLAASLGVATLLASFTRVPALGIVVTAGTIVTSAYALTQLRPARVRGARLAFYDHPAYRLVRRAFQYELVSGYGYMFFSALPAALLAFLVGLFAPNARGATFLMAYLACFFMLGYVQYYGDWRSFLLTPPAPAQPEVKPRHGCIFYLRSFDTEEAPFAHVPRDVPPWQGWPHSGITADVYLRVALAGAFESFEALGDPTRLLPEAGAVRVYLGDDVWREEFARAMERASAVIVTAGISEGLLWELQWIREHAMQGKLFLLNPPETRVTPWLTLSERWRRFVEHSVFQVPRAPTHAATTSVAAWSEVARRLNAIGYCVQDAAPHPGTVSAFDASGRELRLRDRATSPEEFVSAIGQRLNASAL